MKTIAVAGASGFIGSFLIDKILEETPHKVVALSRNTYTNDNNRLAYRKVNLYSLLELENALEGCDTAVYLVHSMASSSRLAQGTFSDFDFVLADNFARACKKNGIKHIIYVGGLIPAGENLSTHLESRKEVEATLSNRGIPCLSIRCSLVIGPGGSSFNILRNLIHRLPLLVLPAWTKTATQPVYIGDLTAVLVEGIDRGGEARGSLDVGGPEQLNYATLIKTMAKAMGKNRYFVHFSLIPLSLSKLWVRVISGASKALVYPLVDSLEHEMIVDSMHSLKNAGFKTECKTGVEEAMKKALKEEKNPQLHPIISKTVQIFPREDVREASEVQSVQRLPFPEGRGARWAAKAYLLWLPSVFRFSLVATTRGNKCAFFLRGVRKPLMVLKHSEDRSSPDRELFYVTRGLLVSDRNKKGRLEIREDPNQQFIITAIHKFVPSLPWYVYLVSQAVVHKLVMLGFGRFIRIQNKRLKEKRKRVTQTLETSTQ